MDMYSLGVLLFIMLVGRKPWDAQRSHTLAYAVQPTCEAPALGDPVYAGLSAPAKQLLLWMLDEDPSRRPSAQQVLGHTWVLQGGVCKVRVGSAGTLRGMNLVLCLVSSPVIDSSWSPSAHRLPTCSLPCCACAHGMPPEHA
jgi:serine/threonine protein kinase